MLLFSTLLPLNSHNLQINSLDYGINYGILKTIKRRSRDCQTVSEIVRSAFIDVKLNTAGQRFIMHWQRLVTGSLPSKFRGWTLECPLSLSQRTRAGWSCQI